jgi:hypothetical protein
MTPNDSPELPPTDAASPRSREALLVRRGSAHDR